jgi:ribosomal protein L16 Arg81 hydroxylase
MLDLDSELHRLFDPISPRTFFARHWERRPLLIRGSTKKFAQLAFSTEALYRIGRDPAESQVCKAWVDMRREIAIDPRSIARHYRAGRSICMRDVQMSHEPLRRVVAAMKATLGLAHEIGFAGYLSPRQQGIPLHCDRHDVFILQIEGTKEWRYARAPSVAFPLTATQPANPASMNRFVAMHARDDAAIPAPRELQRAVLRPGDLLYLPGGTFHATLAAEHSLSLTLGCTPRPMFAMIGQAIERAFQHDPDWRRNPPPAAPGDATSARAIELLLRARVRDLSRWLASADVDTFTSVWRSHLADFAWEPPVAARPTLDPASALVRAWPVTTGGRRTGPVEVVAANRVFTVPRRHRRLVDGLASHPQFTARDSQRWGRCSWPTARAFLELMLHHGIVEHA